MRVARNDKPSQLVNLKKGDILVHKYSGVTLGTVFSIGKTQIRYYDAKGNLRYVTAPETNVIREKA